MQFSVEFAAEVVKQLITISSAFLGLSITLLPERYRIRGRIPRTLIVSWICLLASIALGILTLMAMTGAVSGRAPTPSEGVYAGNIRFLSVAQIGAFLNGVVFLVLHGLRPAKRTPRAQAVDSTPTTEVLSHLGGAAPPSSPFASETPHPPE